MASLQILLFLCITVTVSAEVHLQKRIYGGKDCAASERLYHVALEARDSNGYYPLCGGSLISDSWVLTAAHCLDATRTMYAKVGVHPGPQMKEVEIPIKNIFPRYENGKQHDIMLLQLPQKITNIPTIALPDCTKEPNVTDIVQVAGYGNYKLNGTNYEKPGSPSRLQCGKMVVEQCIKRPINITSCFPNEPAENWLCAKPSQGETCKGDSGGGVVYNDKIYAVVSGGPDCHDDFTSVFLRICPYIGWINNTTKIKH